MATIKEQLDKQHQQIADSINKLEQQGLTKGQAFQVLALLGCLSTWTDPREDPDWNSEIVEVSLDEIKDLY